MQKDEDFIATLKDMPGSSEKSIETYINNIKRGVKDTNAPTIRALLTKPAKYIPVLRENVKVLNSRISVYIAIITTMRASGLKFEKHEAYNKWYSAMMDDKSTRRRDEIKQIASDAHTESELKWERVLQVRDALPKDSPDYLLLAMYTYVPPRRQEDYALLRVYTNPEVLPKMDHNHFHLAHPRHGPYFYIHSFKTASSIGTFFNNRYIPKELIEAIRVSLKTRPRDYMFVQKNDEPFKTTNSYTKYSNGVIKRLFDNPHASVNSLRHAFAKWFNSHQDITVYEHSIVARQMGHTITKNRLYNHYKEQQKMVFLPNETTY